MMAFMGYRSTKIHGIVPEDREYVLTCQPVSKTCGGRGAGHNFVVKVVCSLRNCLL
jgi:hypothetical protein